MCCKPYFEGVNKILLVYGTISSELDKIRYGRRLQTFV